MRALLRALGVLGLAAVAAACGVAAVMLSRESVTAGGVPLPWGLVLGVVAPAALFWSGGQLLGRVGALVPAGVWLAVVVVALLPRGEGDIVLAGDGYGLGFVLLALAVVVWTALRAGRR